MDALDRIASEVGLPAGEIDGSSKHHIVFKILEARAKKQGLLFEQAPLPAAEESSSTESGPHGDDDGEPYVREGRLS